MAEDLQLQIENLKQKIKDDLAKGTACKSSSSPSSSVISSEDGTPGDLPSTVTSDGPGPAFYAEQYKNHGNEAFRRGQYSIAIEMFTKGLAFDATNAVLYSNRSACHCHLRKWVKALEDANSCIRFRPDWPKGHIRRGAALHGYGYLDKALDAYQTAYKGDLENPEYLSAVEAINKEIMRKEKSDRTSELREKAKEQFGKGDYKGAAGFYKKAIEEDDSDAVLFSNRAACFIHLQKYAKAIEDAEKAISLSPNWAKGWRRKADAYYAWRKYPEAIQAYKKVLELEPSDDLKNLIMHIQNEQITRQYVKDDMMPGGGKRKSTFLYGASKKQKDDDFDYNEKW